ncbi:PKD domain-containing protein [Candidatus Bipolaricaulota bacterium]|nr:PKD domain-containing protein [Candidatus Bipolaricaulota bacterium]
MRSRWLSLFGSFATLLLVALVGHGFEANFEPSTFNPTVGEFVNFEVCEPCLGDGSAFHYAWDFDGDGQTDLETQDALVSTSYASAGFHQVRLTVFDANGRRVSRSRGILVGEYPAVAVREFLPQGDGSVFVLITITVLSDLSGLGFEESMPQGWQMVEVDVGGAITNRNAAERILEVLWAMQLEAGEEISFSYRLHPSYATATTELSGELSGYSGGGRFAGGICGDLELGL